MIRTPALGFMLLFTVAVAGCDSDDSVTPEDDPLEAFEGSWSATSFVYTSQDDPDVSVPVLQAVEGSSVGVDVEDDGEFVASINLGSQTNDQTVQIPGTIEHEGNDRITVTFESNPFFTAPLDVVYEFQTQNTLTWETSTTFDFNQDGTPTPATLNVVFQRS